MSAHTTRLTGVAASPGSVFGIAQCFTRRAVTIPTGAGLGADHEAARVREASGRAVAELERLKNAVMARLGRDHAHIIRMQQTIAEDEAIIGEICERIAAADERAEVAVDAIFSSYRTLFAALDDGSYNAARISDLDDVHCRLQRILQGQRSLDLAALPPESVVVAEDLFPSQTALLDPACVVGIITERGGPTSHAAIFARSLSIPAAVGVGGALALIDDGDPVALAVELGEEAIVIIRPDPTTIGVVENAARIEADRRRVIESVRHLPPQTSDGTAVSLAVNLGTADEIGAARAAGATAVGLVRTEFQFIGVRRLPTEDEQTEVYGEIASAFPDGVVFRTLDVGGDKVVPGLGLPEETNPFLGLRGVRVSLEHPDLFHRQLRAILRAGAAGGAIHIMFPMVGSVDEVRRATEAVRECEADLSREGVPFASTVRLGIMVEVPSAIFMMRELVEHVAFVSIGTNDLAQYLLAADRLNTAVAPYYRSYDPALFRAIDAVCRAAEPAGCPVSVCGELGGDPLAIPALIGLGVTSLSMSAPLLAEARWTVRRGTASSMRRLARAVCDASTETDVRELLHTFHRKGDDGAR